MAVITNTIDWNDLWREAVLKASAKKRRSNQIDFWDRKALIYGKMEAAEGRKRAQQAISRLDIDDKTTILDIGCGPGTLAIPLAKAARSITALDQSPGMLVETKRRAEIEQLTNIQYINSKWEDIITGSGVFLHDIVIASYSLDMLDIRRALQKIHETATQAVCLYWFAGNNDSSVYTHLWPQVFNGESYQGSPDFIYLLNILYCMGIYPNVEVTTLESKHLFPKLEDAVDYWRDNFQVDSPEQIEIIRQYLLKNMARENEGFYYHRTMRVCMIWWRKNQGKKTAEASF